MTTLRATQPHGLPGQLPKGESILWQGAPNAARIARSVFRLPFLAAYFTILLALRAAFGLDGGTPIVPLVIQLAELSALACVTLGLFWIMARLVARTTVYTITNRRVVMQIGVVLDLTLNLPLVHIDAVALRARRDGTGDIPLTLDKSSKIAYPHLWPHARPWRLARPEPMLRAVDGAAEVAQLLIKAIEEREASPIVVPLRAPNRPSERTEPALAAS